MVSGPFPPADASGRSVVLGVGGGIAAYKVCELLRRFTESGHDVTVVPTESALKFVGAASWEALSGKPVHSDVFSDVPSVQHVRLGQQADLVFVAPATADLMAKAAHGRADDLLTSTLLTATCPVVYAPAMHTEMWQHPATRANVATLRARGALVLPPAHGRLTGADSGPGRLPEPLQLFELATNVLLASVGRAESSSAEDSCDQDGGEDDRTSSFRRDLQGRRVLVTAGGTREHLDPVRYLGNNSSGRQGFALAAAAVARGAEVTLVAANVEMSTPYGVTRRNVVSASELRDVVLRDSLGQHAVVM
ncbi:MAG: bifunctional phosphopantothenoylcysteine decarboxylase/phosphopantothenate synthase, partial [Nocardioidaceae bacterium]